MSILSLLTSVAFTFRNLPLFFLGQFRVGGGVESPYHLLVVRLVDKLRLVWIWLRTLGPCVGFLVVWPLVTARTLLRPLIDLLLLSLLGPSLPVLFVS